MVALGHLTADAAHLTTSSNSVVFLARSDPVVGGCAASLTHPGGNMTGLT